MLPLCSYALSCPVTHVFDAPRRECSHTRSLLQSATAGLLSVPFHLPSSSSPCASHCPCPRHSDTQRAPSHQLSSPAHSGIAPPLLLLRFRNNPPHCAAAVRPTAAHRPTLFSMEWMTDSSVPAAAAVPPVGIAAESKKYTSPPEPGTTARNGFVLAHRGVFLIASLRVGACLGVCAHAASASPSGGRWSPCRRSLPRQKRRASSMKTRYCSSPLRGKPPAPQRPQRNPHALLRDSARPRRRCRPLLRCADGAGRNPLLSRMNNKP